MLVHLVRWAFRPPHVHIFSVLLVLNREKSRRQCKGYFKQTKHTASTKTSCSTNTMTLFFQSVFWSRSSVVVLRFQVSHTRTWARNQHICVEKIQFDYLFINIYYLTAARLATARHRATHYAMFDLSLKFFVVLPLFYSIVANVKSNTKLMVQQLNMSQRKETEWVYRVQTVTVFQWRKWDWHANTHTQHCHDIWPIFHEWINVFHFHSGFICRVYCLIASIKESRELFSQNFWLHKNTQRVWSSSIAAPMRTWQMKRNRNKTEETECYLDGLRTIERIHSNRFNGSLMVNALFDIIRLWFKTKFRLIKLWATERKVFFIFDPCRITFIDEMLEFKQVSNIRKLAVWMERRKQKATKNT